jgi:hypothetical protein
MRRQFHGLRWCLAALIVATTTAPSSTRLCAAEVLGRQCACAHRPLDEIVRGYLSSVDVGPVRRTVPTGYFVLGTTTEASLRTGEVPKPSDFSGVHRFRVDASWARPPAARGIGPTISLYARHDFCVAARYYVGQQYLLHVGFAGDTLVNLVPCGSVFPSDSGTTRAAVTLLDSAFKRR